MICINFTLYLPYDYHMKFMIGTRRLILASSLVMDVTRPNILDRKTVSSYILSKGRSQPAHLTWNIQILGPF